MSGLKSEMKSSTERHLTITRTVNAHRGLVFKMWTDCEHLGNWWGPELFTNPICEVDARVGGDIRIIMRSPDGRDYPMSGEFREVEEPERIVFTNVAEDRAGNPVLDGFTTVTFSEEGRKTKLVLQTRSVALVPGAIVHLQGMDIGWAQSIDRLERYLARVDD